MTIEELNERNSNPKVMELKSMISDKSSDKYYVFISYKSDDWKIVLTEILYKLATKYGLNFYYDGSFDLHNNSWVQQFPENMGSDKCAAVLAFLDEKYTTSYATLMELMHSQSYNVDNDDGLPIIPINLEDLKKVDGELGNSDTGLGQKYFDDGKENVNAQAEKELFLMDYEQVIERNYIKHKYYNDKIPLKKRICSKMVKELLAFTKSGYNTNIYSDSEAFYSYLVATIKNECKDKNVFSEVKSSGKKPAEKAENPVNKKAAENKPAAVLPDVQDVSESVLENSAANKKIIYTLYGKEYTDNQANMLLNVFAKVLKNHPEAVDKILENPEKPLLRCASAINYELPENKKLDKPTRYNTGCYFPIGRGIFIGTGLNYEEKLRNISMLLDICKEDFSILQSEQIELKKDVKRRESSSGEESYTIDGKQYSGNQTQMMIDTIRYMMEKHFDKRGELSALLSIKLAPLSELSNVSYFHVGEEFNFSGTVYSIGTSFGRNDKLKQIRKVAAICGEDPKQFNIAGLDDASVGASRQRRNFLDD